MALVLLKSPGFCSSRQSEGEGQGMMALSFFVSEGHGDHGSNLFPSLTRSHIQPFLGWGAGSTSTVLGFCFCYSCGCFVTAFGSTKA
jgi:hypothetical protein